MHLMEFATCDRRKDKRLIFVRPSKMVKMQAEMVETTMEERVRDLQELATIAENKVIDCKNCWEKEENKHKRPHNFKPRGQVTENGGEKGNVNVDGNVAGEVELLLSCFDTMITDGSGSDVVNCSIKTVELVDCDVGPWDISFDEDDVVKIGNCERKMWQDQEIVSEGNPVVRKTVTWCNPSL